MSITKKLSKFLANGVYEVSTHIANTSTKACTALNLEEPKMPEALLKRKNS